MMHAHLAPALMMFLCVASAGEDKPPLTAEMRLAELNREGLVNVMFWCRPDLMQPLEKFYPRWEPKWTATVANHSKEEIVLNTFWFTHIDWLRLVDEASGKGVPSYSTFPSEGIVPLRIPPNSAKEISLGGIIHFTCLVGRTYDEGVKFESPGTYKLTHTLFPAAEMRFAINEQGAIRIHYPGMYPRLEKPNKARLDNPLPRPKSEIEP